MKLSAKKISTLNRQAAKEKGESHYIPGRPCLRGHNLRYAATGYCVGCKSKHDKDRAARVKEAYQGEGLYYIPDVPCNRGHSLRYSASGGCVECARLKENARVAANREAYNARKVRENAHKLPLIAERARLARTVETSEQRKVRLEKAIARSVKWRQENPDHPNTRFCKTRWTKNNPGKVQAIGMKRKIAKMHRTPSWLSPTDIWLMEEIYILSELRTRLTGIQWNVDHIIPLQGRKVSGLHVPMNLQVIPALLNFRKANKW